MNLANFKSNSNGLANQTTVSNDCVGNIPYRSIVFLNDGHIWTHNKVFDCRGSNAFVTITGDQTISGNKTFNSSVTIDSLTTGNLVNTGSASFSSTIVGNIQSADKVNKDLTIQLNGGNTEGANKFIFNGSEAITVDITPSNISAMSTSHAANDITLNDISNWNSTFNSIKDYVKKEADITLQPVHSCIQPGWPDLKSQGTSHSHGGTQYSNVPDAAWKLSGNDGLLKDTGDGSYLLQIVHTTDNDGAIYTGYFSYTTGKGTDEEIMLHRSGNISEQRLFAKIKYIESNGTYLLLSAIKEEGDCTELTINIKKLL